ncbi:MAG: hypothetical protein V5A44_07060 [Haloarculaceae archaeon]
MGEEFRAVFAGEATESAELLEVVVTPGEGDREPVEKQKRDALPSRRPERGLTGSTPDRSTTGGRIRR